MAADKYVLRPVTNGYRAITTSAFRSDNAIFENGIGSISEIYDGNPPHEARGCISQSTSVAALLYLNHVINYLKNDDPLYAIHHVFGNYNVNNNIDNGKDAIHRVSKNKQL